MKLKFTLNFLLTVICTSLFGQADLVVTNNYAIQTTNISVGDYLSFKFRVRNIGNIASPKSHTLIYLSPTNTVTANSIPLSNISTESLDGNTETQDINYIYPLPFNCASGTNYIIIQVDSRNEVVESNEVNNYYIPNTINVNSIIGGQQNIPYPMIFIHGLNSDNTTWNNTLIDFQNYYGWSFGGNMNFCLNQSSTSTNKYVDYKDWTDTNTLYKGDFYTVNFDVDRIGKIHPTSLTAVLSNQSAIVKQGLAIKDAIKYVLQKTGRDKVILVGHSMGGLASREYIQNSILWQQDGNHHVAKLLTVGTPHGGSNASLSVLSNAIGVDNKSEAVRDLRTSYFYSSKPGVYLFGGTENDATMNDLFLASFYNVDVNCNGVDADGSTIVGLNQKNISNTLNYSCIIGNGVLTGDGVVYTANANLKNYYSTLSVDTFMVSALHTSLPSQTEVIVKGLDESNEYNRSYDVKTNQLYFGNFSVQSQNLSSSVYDYDDYRFTISQNGNININIYDIPLSKCFIKLLDSAKNIIYKDTSNGQSYWELNRVLTAGKYYFEIFGIPDSKTWRSPYAFKINYTPTLPLTLLDFTASLQKNSALLKWTTKNEVNTNKFDIERSINGVDWNTLSNKDAISLGGINNYDFIDSNPNYGINYYRLKMIDQDGSYTYSPIRTIEFSKPNKTFVIAPNPAKSSTVIYFNTPTSKAEISIYDAQGRQVYINTHNGASLSKFELNTSNFLNGFYLVTIKTGDKNYNERLIISK